MRDVLRSRKVNLITHADKYVQHFHLLSQPNQSSYIIYTPVRTNHYANSFRVAVSIHNFVYSRCANWKFQGNGSLPFPSAVVSTSTLFK
jgi:hypothetical protein